MFDYSAIKQQVIDYTGEYAEDYDIDEVMDELREADVQSINDVDIDEILQRHDVSGK